MAKIAASGALSQTDATGATTLTVVTPIVGALRLLSVGIVASNSVTGIAGGGVSRWSLASSEAANSTDIELWWGQVANTSSSPTTLTMTPASSVASAEVEMVSQMFVTDRLRPQWYCHAGSGVTGSSTSIAWASLTPTSGAELYFGTSLILGTGTAGSTSGFTNGITSGGTNPYCYNASLTATAAPTATQSPSGWWNAVSALMGVADAGDPNAAARQNAVVRSNFY